MLFNEKLIQHRRERGMTQEDLADRLSVSRQTVSKWENGECMPDADKFIRLSDILEISLDELAGRENAAAPIAPPAPELPRPRNRLRRFLIGTLACLLIGAGGVVFGRYVVPKQQPSVQTLPDTLTASDIVWSSRAYDQGVGFSFASNVSVSSEATVYLYAWKEDGTEEAVELETSYENGLYHTALVPSGYYPKVVFAVREGKQERSVFLAKNLNIEITKNNCGVDECEVNYEADGLPNTIYITLASMMES